MIERRRAFIVLNWRRILVELRLSERLLGAERLRCFKFNFRCWRKMIDYFPGGKLLKNKNLERTFPGGNVLLSFGAQSGS
ncbi:MAG: hypothetical protein ACTS42_00835 [Candidatus Hodgkinia cicadicola]